MLRKHPRNSKLFGNKREKRRRWKKRVGMYEIKINPDFFNHLKNKLPLLKVFYPIIPARLLVNDDLCQISRLSLFNPLFGLIVNGCNKDHPNLMYGRNGFAMPFYKVSEKGICITWIPRRKGQNSKWLHAVKSTEYAMSSTLLDNQFFELNS